MLASVVVAGATGAMVAPTATEGRAGSAPAPDHAGKIASTVRATTTTTVSPPTTSTTDPGVLPQTGAFPSTSDPIFTAEMAALWHGVSTGAVQDALPAFFPEAAYVQLKAVPNAQGDFVVRLEAEYAQDLIAAHQLLGGAAATAELVRVDVNSAYAHWVPAGACYNDVGYFEVPNSRVVYSVNGQVSSFGIASMVSWRGGWYVIHLGAVLRSGGVGQVDDPQSGPGSPTYYPTC